MRRRDVLRFGSAAVVAALLAACGRNTRALSAPAPTPTPQPPAPRVVPSAAPSRGPAVKVVHGDRNGTQVALTFHGAGDPALAISLLEAAERASARVTVLAVGTWLEANPSVAKRILSGGHELGNHTYTHPTLTHLDAAATFEEISRCADVLRRAVGSAGTWFRPSGTPHATPRILEEAGRAGYARTLSYDVDTLDYTDPGAAAVLAKAKAEIRPGSVVSLHLGHAGTVEALPGILDHLKAHGWSAVTASELLGA